MLRDILVGEDRMRGLDIAFWEDGGHFNDRRLPVGEEVRAQGSLREREGGSVVTKLRGV